ncbi:hypothetical protein CCAX7_14830 [Capsulimonas corticalis]|uniref:Uncharacterized protein n=2 Tax=Capsulimonas corticalis TaxID=2219043 RepID=A0A402CZH6_9BACT|nr:hypothetical protein CCAX7_14830 [Capsulimonas corticalis]
MAARKTGVNYTTINQMLRGDRPKSQTIERFGEKLGADIPRLLQLAGYLPEGIESILCDGLIDPARYFHRLGALPNFSNTHIDNIEDFNQLTFEQKGRIIEILQRRPANIFLPPGYIYKNPPDNIEDLDFDHAVYEDWFNAHLKFAEALLRRDENPVRIDNAFYVATNAAISYSARSALLREQYTGEGSPPREYLDGDAKYNSLLLRYIKLSAAAAEDLMEWFFRSVPGVKASEKFNPIFKVHISSFDDYSRFNLEDNFCESVGVGATELLFHDLVGIDRDEMYNAMEDMREGNPETLPKVIQKWGAIQALYVQKYNEGDMEVLALDGEMEVLFKKICGYFVELDSRPFQQADGDGFVSVVDQDGNHSKQHFSIDIAERTYASRQVLTECYATANALNQKLLIWYLKTKAEAMNASVAAPSEN